MMGELTASGRRKRYVIDYEYHDDSGANAVKTLLLATRPDIILQNTPAGLWGTPTAPATYEANGSAVYSYITGDYENTGRVDGSGNLAANIARIPNIATEGCTGVFLDEVSNYPDAAAKIYIQAIYDQCVISGVKLMLNTGLENFDTWLLARCDYIMSEEAYDGTRTPTASERAAINKVLVCQVGIGNAVAAAANSNAAFRNGFKWAYACNVYTTVPVWLADYFAKIKGFVTYIKRGHIWQP